MANDPTLKKPMSDRESLKARLRALLAKTTANGCTEPEAASAMAAAARIMAAHGLDLDDVETVQSAPIRLRRAREFGAYLSVWATIRFVCSCTWSYTWLRQPGGRPVLTGIYHGRAHDVLLAEYLRALCDRAIRRAHADFRASKTWRLKRSRKTRDLEMDAFTEGLCLRLSSSIFDTFRSRVPPMEKPAPVDDTPDDLTPAEARRAAKLSREWARKAARRGFAAGVLAGEQIQVAEPVNGASNTPLMIGSGK